MTQTKTAVPLVFELVPAPAQAVAPPTPSLDDLTAMIRHSHREAINAVARGAWYAIQAGHALTRAKAELKAQRLSARYSTEIVGVHFRDHRRSTRLRSTKPRTIYCSSTTRTTEY